MDPHLLDEARRVGTLCSVRLHLVIPSVMGEGETFSLRISAMGGDALPAEGFTHRLVFDGCIGVEGLPASVVYCSEEGVSLDVDGLRATGPEVAVVRARVEETGCYGGDPVIASNPAWIYPEPPYRIYWGDLHVHTSYSDCNRWSCLDPEFCYQYAREVTFLDFVAACDHLRGIAAQQGRWERLQQLVAEYDQPGRFVPFLAFESSHAKGFGGDNNVYFRDMTGPMFWLDRDDMKGIAPKVHLKELWQFLDEAGQEYMTAPHHTARARKNRTFDEPYYDSARESLFEIYSGWGSSDAPPPNGFPLAGGNSTEKAYFTDALQAGCRYGVIAASDDHATHPGGQSRHRGAPLGLKTLSGHHHQGLAAVRSSELTRDALWHAMRDRRTYATTLARSLVDVRIGDIGMGQERRLEVSDPLRRQRSVEVLFTPQPIAGATAEITLLRNGHDLMTQSFSGEELGPRRTMCVFEDTQPIDEAALSGAMHHPAPFVCYHVRIRDAANSTQWSSPIWLDL